MKRGDLYVAALPGDYGKPRPVVVVQNDDIDNLESKIICPLTTYDEPVAFLRLRVDPTAENGLESTSFVMVEKIITVPTWRFRQHIGRLEASALDTVSNRLAVILGLV